MAVDRPLSLINPFFELHTVPGTSGNAAILLYRLYHLNIKMRSPVEAAEALERDTAILYRNTFSHNP